MKSPVLKLEDIEWKNLVMHLSHSDRWPTVLLWNGEDGGERRWFCNGEDQKRERRDGGFGMEMMER